MKEIWKKTSLLYKMIAVILTVVMVGTTLYFHFDKKYEAKAAGEIEVLRAYLPDDTVPDEQKNMIGGENGWQIINSGSVQNDTNRKFAYLYKVPDGITFISNPYRYFSADPSITTDFGGFSNFTYGGYTYYIDSVAFNDDTATNSRVICYQVTDQEFVTDNYSFTAFSWMSDVDANISMTAKIGETNFDGGSFNTLGTSDSVVINITTGNEITSFKVFGVDKTSDLISGNSDNYDSQTRLYTYNYTYQFGTLGEIAKEFSTDELSVTANAGPSGEATYTASSIKYDATKPVINITKVGADDYNSDIWYKNGATTATLTVSSGSDSSGESDITSITVNGENKTFTPSSSVVLDLSVNEGTNNYTISATDAAGNTSATASFIIKMDNTAPKVNSLEVGGVNTDDKFIGLNSENDVIISGDVSDNSEGSEIQKINISIKTTDDSEIVNKDFEVQSDNTYSAKLSDVFGISNTELINGSKDGKYKIVVTAKDIAGNESGISDSKELKFTLDSTKPVITYALERHAAGDAEDVWEEVPSEDIYTESNTYYVNNVTYDKLRYKIVITETNLEEPVVCKNADSDVEIGNFEKDSTNPNTYYYVIDSDDSKLTMTEALSLKAIVKDKAENVNEDDNQILLPKLQLVDTDIKVELVEVWCDGEKLADISNLSDLASDFNKIYTIKVKAKSGFKMTDMELRIGEETYSAVATDEIGDNSDTTGIHTTDVVEFTLPTVEENKKFDALNVYVKNENENDASVSLGDLLYDNTVPVVKNNDTEVDYSKWYQDYTFDYEIKSGESAVESDLKNAKYSVDEQATELTPSGTTENGSIDVPESKSIAGTKIAFEAEDKATNTMPNGDGIFNIRVDKTAPAVAAIKVNGKKVTEKNVFSGAPQITSTITDNLTIQGYMVTVKYNDETYAGYPVLVNKDEKQEAVSYTLKQVIGSKDLTDGKYTVNISATDKSGRNSNVSSTTFVVDNTAPVVSASIISGTSGKSNGYYNTDVVVRITCKDNNFDASAMSVTDNGSAVSANWQRGNDIYYADIVLSAEGLHDIRVSGKDKAGTDAEAKQVSFVIDKTAPVVALLVNGGQLYNGGTLNLTGPLTLTASVTDTNDDAADLRVQIIKTVPDTATTTSEFIPTGERTFTFADEADYVVNLFSVDKANNMGVTRTISFRVDTTAPQITITGAGGTASSATSVSFNITEAFWSDASGKVDIYRKAGDGIDETLYKTLTISPTQKVYSISELLRESGIYRFEFNADDKVGHTATASQSITVDVNKPEINLSGVNNYDSTDGSVSISAIIKDEFYANKKVSIQGTRTDATGKKNPISFSPYAATANPTTINDTFTEEGIYDITITATDIAGNVSSNSVHFTIDTSEPVIGDLSAYDKKTFNAKSFEELGLDLDLDELVSDITVCDVRMYLNGSEYDGISEIEDGSYTLLITAEDELGHSSEKSATFVLDTKEPIFIVTGVEDGEVRNDSYSIEVSLQLDEDTLDEVKLNDTVITVKNNVASISVTDKGEYELYMKATDEAGNEAEQTISFTFGNEETSVATTVSNAVEKASSHWWIWAIVVAAILAVGGFIFFILKRRKED
ncbi:MAG: hypothetical protein IJ224_12070 [Lachnospiraceae bacterium]|nr:hypothetical protein [Lachnospiraceae bacterium]